MLISVPELISKEDVLAFRAALDAAEWESGQTTAGTQAALVKNNQQLPLSSPVAEALGQRILAALSKSPLFLSAALPLRILPPMFNRYSGGEHFGIHVDNAIRIVPGTAIRIRTDLSCTLFLSEPEDYDGGELIIEDHYGVQSVKLAAGDLVVYPSTSLHKVEPVTRGARVASFFWLQSMIREDAKRSLLFDLDQSIQDLTFERGAGNAAVVRLSGIYHNLIRTWAET